MVLADDGDFVSVVDPRDAAESAGLAYVHDDEPGIDPAKGRQGLLLPPPERGAG